MRVVYNNFDIIVSLPTGEKSIQIYSIVHTDIQYSPIISKEKDAQITVEHK
jgi:hypothetical protein